MVTPTETPAQSGRAFNPTHSTDRNPSGYPLPRTERRRAKGHCMDWALIRGRLPDLIKGACGGAVIAMVIGFQWGGWVLGSTAATQTRDAEQAGIVRVLAPICADKFQHAADAGANLTALLRAESWNRNEIITKAGWTTFPGSEPDRRVAEACVNLLSQTK